MFKVNNKSRRHWRCSVSLLLILSIFHTFKCGTAVLDYEQLSFSWVTSSKMLYVIKYGIL